MKRNRKSFTALSLALMLALGLGLMSQVSAASLVEPQVIDSILNTTTDKAMVQSPFIEAVNTIRDSVVGVNNYQASTQGQGGFGMPFQFEDTTPRGRQSIFTGSGVVISPYGHILTNYHVVDGAQRVTVTYGTKEAEATVVASDEGLDIAVLLVSGIELEPVALGDSDQVQVGEWAIVIGNPLGQEFERTVTAGIISAFNREVSSRTTDRYGRRGTVTNAMIQVDAAINNGNSGGGMFNTLGQLQGIPSLKYDSRGGFGNSASIDNIGMCLPINSAKPLIRQALEQYDGDAITPAAIIDHEQTNDPNRPRMGVTVTTLDTASVLLAQGILPQGAYIMEVEAGSPAERAGLKPGDIIVETNGTVVSSSTAMIGQLSGLQTGAQVTLKYFRAAGLHAIITQNADPSSLGDGEYLDTTVSLAVLPTP